LRYFGIEPFSSEAAQSGRIALLFAFRGIILFVAPGNEQT
jgi:hypothetical protein